MFVCSVAVSSWLSAQQQLSASSLFMVSDILYCRALGWGFWVQTAKGHPPNRGSDHVHICYTSHLIPYDAAHTHGGDPMGCHHSNGHSTMGHFRGHFQRLWHLKAGCHACKVAQWSCWPYNCQCLYWRGGFGWGGSLWWRDWRLCWSSPGELGWSSSWPWGLAWWGDLPSSHHWSRGMQNFFPPQELWATPLHS